MIAGRPPFEAETITACSARAFSGIPLRRWRSFGPAADVAAGARDRRCSGCSPGRTRRIASPTSPSWRGRSPAFGSPTAVASADRISRIVEGGGDHDDRRLANEPAERSSPRGGSTPPSSSRRASPAHPPLRSPAPGLPARGGGCPCGRRGHRVDGRAPGRQSRGARCRGEAARGLEEAAPVPVVTAVPVLHRRRDCPRSPPPFPAPVPVSRLNTTSALTPGAASSEKPSLHRPTVAPAPVVAAPVARTPVLAAPAAPAPAAPAPAKPRRQHPIRRAEPPRPEPSVPTPPEVDNPYAQGNAPRLRPCRPRPRPRPPPTRPSCSRGASRCP